jgi:gamma-glutamylcysteine synthetase
MDEDDREELWRDLDEAETGLSGRNSSPMVVVMMVVMMMMVMMMMMTYAKKYQNKKHIRTEQFLTYTVLVRSRAADEQIGKMRVYVLQIVMIILKELTDD